MQSLLSIQNIDFVYATTRRHYLISCIGLKRYEEVEVILENVQVFTKTELCCLLVAKYNKSKEEYKKLYEYILETTSTNNLFLNALNDYLLYILRYIIHYQIHHKEQVYLFFVRTIFPEHNMSINAIK